MNRKTTEFKTKGKDNESKDKYEHNKEKEVASLLKEIESNVLLIFSLGNKSESPLS